MFGLLRILIVGAGLFMLMGLVRSLSARYRGEPRLLQYHLLHLGLWVGAVLSLSQCFAVYRRLAGEQPNPYPIYNLVIGLVAAGVLISCFLTLGFFMYREDSRNGKIKRKMPLYERFLEGPPKGTG